MTTPRRFRDWGVVWLLIPMVSAMWLHSLALAQAPAAARPAKIIEAPPLEPRENAEFRAIQTREGNTGQLLPTDGPLIDKKIAFDLAAFTLPQVRDAGPAEAAKLRGELRTRVTTASRLPFKDFHKALNSAILKHAAPIITDNEVSPHARTNLVVLVSSLDRQEREGTTPAIALPEGTVLLLEFLKNDNLPAFVHVAAAEGLVRHTELETTPPQRKEITATIAKYLTTAKPESYDPAGWQWLRKRSAHILQSFAERSLAEANDPALIAGLIAMAGEDQLSFSIRVDALGALGAYEGKTLASSNKLKEALIAAADTARAVLTACADPAKTQPHVVQVLAMLGTIADSIERTDASGATNLAPNKGIRSGSDPSLKTTAKTLHGKVVTCYEGLRKPLPSNAAEAAKAKLEEGAQRDLLKQTLGEVELILKELRGSPVAVAPSK